MIFKDAVTPPFSRGKREHKFLAKMLKSEKDKIKLYTKSLRKITFNELLIRATLILVVVFALSFCIFGVYLSLNGLFSKDVHLGMIGIIGDSSRIILCTISAILCAVTAFKLFKKAKIDWKEHQSSKRYAKAITKEYQSLNNLILEQIKQDKTGSYWLNSKEILSITEQYEDNINENTKDYLVSFTQDTTKKYVRFYIYNNSHISNGYTNVLHIHSTTLTIYSHCLSYSDSLSVKDLLDISVKSICINY